MPKPSRKELSPLQSRVMKVLWDHGESTVSEVLQALETERSLAHNTVATILTRLASDGIVTVRREGRMNVYKPALAENTVKRTMVSGLLARLFEGDASALVHHLVSEGELDADELESLAKLVSESKPTKLDKQATETTKRRTKD